MNKQVDLEEIIDEETKAEKIIAEIKKELQALKSVSKNATNKK